MKLFFYSILALVAFCINLGIAETLDACCSDSSATTSESQFVAQQEQTTSQAIQNLYEHFCRMSCDMVKNSSDIPIAKYVLRQTRLYNGNPELLISHKNNAHFCLYYFSDPITYYIYGQRKIII